MALQGAFTGTFKERIFLHNAKSKVQNKYICIYLNIEILTFQELIIHSSKLKLVRHKCVGSVRDNVREITYSFFQFFSRIQNKNVIFFIIILTFI